jgi:hypothetical protein
MSVSENINHLPKRPCLGNGNGTNVPPHPCGTANSKAVI